MDAESLFGATKVLMMAISFKIIFMESGTTKAAMGKIKANVMILFEHIIWA